MSILDINKQEVKHSSQKTVVVFLILSALAVVIDKVYALFAHGVSSDAMTWMFLYPLIQGALFYLLLGSLLPQLDCFYGYRLFYNLYNSGIAVITTGSFLKGIMDIAGTSSVYVNIYYITGYILLGAGVILLLILAANYRKLILKSHEI